MRTQKLWNNGWEFYFDRNCGETLTGTEATWQAVTLPHDWQIWNVKNLYEDGTGWYRKTFMGRPAPGMCCCLYFEGVYMDSAVFVNGSLAKQWKYGYSSFQVDITDLLGDGENQVLVRCCLRHPNSRWYSGAGIYRDVWRIDYPQSHIVTDGMYISTREQEDGTWILQVQTQTERTRPWDRLAYTLLEEGGRIAAQFSTAVGETGHLRMERPKLWDVEHPNCYVLRCDLVRDGQLLDQMDSVCGFRTLELTADRGLFLNHRNLVLHGVALHHDLGCLGAAFSMVAARRQLEIMKDMGVNALRTAHNMPAPGVMELADQMGFLVIDEAFDCWEREKNPYDYARFFPEWYCRDVASWICRDRNHPSLMLWSIGNEIYDTHADSGGQEILHRLVQEVTRYDPWKNGRITFGSNYMAWENTQKCAEFLDAVGYNYGESLYRQHHEQHPSWVIYGSETASIVQSRGVYHFPLSRPLLVDDDLQCSSLGNSRTSWGAKNHQACLAADEQHPYSLGQFLWSGFDYIGEPTPYHTKNSYFGLVDTAGFLKDAYYLYQAGWHSWRDKPVLHLLPYWDFNPGQCIDVCIFSNLPQVELLVNGVSMGRKNLGGGSDVQANWQVTYAPGCIQAIGYDHQGRPVAQTQEHSFSDGTRLVIETDRKRVDNSGRDLVFCTVSAVDGQGHPVRNANNSVRVELSGALALVGMDNGNSADMDAYKTNIRKMFSGKLLIVAAGWGEGSIGGIRVSSPGLESAYVEVEVTSAEQERFAVLPGIACREEIQPVPVRKVLLTADSVRLTREQPQTEIHARIEPPQAQEEELTWRVIDEQGITSPNIRLEVMDGGRTVRAIGAGDGAVRVRCACGLILSDLELTVEGMGTLCQNPYEFVSAALYTKSEGEIGSGNERGIATDRIKRSWVAYEKLDFGSSGGDTLTISVFEMAGNPMPIRFWKGIPYAPGSRMIGERIYHKPTRWNVYQDECFRLEEPLRRRDVFGVELEGKVHIKGFVFRERSRAWDRLRAMDYDMAYGDRFACTDTAVEGIGNNVSLLFRGLDFGSQGTCGILLRGKSRLDNNTIHLCFEGEQTSVRQVVEFPGSTDWREIRFPLDPVRGKQNVTFLFLPGCDFDFLDFQFLPGE